MTNPAYSENAVLSFMRTALFIGDDRMNIFEEVKAAVDINTAAEYYGLNVRKDTALCPFHNEKDRQLEAVPRPFLLFRLRRTRGRYQAHGQTAWTVAH